MDDLIQNAEAQKLAQMLQQQQMQKFLQALQGAGAGMGAMSELDRQQIQRQPATMFGQQIQQGDFTQQATPMLGQPLSQGNIGGRTATIPYTNSPSGISAQEYEMMRRMPR